MAQNLIVNGITYNGVESIEMKNASGEIVSFVNAEDYLSSVLNKTAAEIVNSKVTAIYNNFQSGNTNLLKVDLPLVKTINSGAFNGCKNLKSVNLPSVTTIDSAAFELCWSIPELYLPSLTETTGWGYIFNSCSFKRVVFPVFTGTIRATTFNACQSMETLVLGADSVCTLENTSAFRQTPIALYNNKVGYIYVKKALVESYKSATNWSTFAAQFRAIEDYPEVLEGLE